MTTARRWLLVVLALVALAGVFRLRMDVQILDLLPSGLKVVQGLKLYQEYFSNQRELIVTLRLPDATAADAAAESLAGAFSKQTNLIATVRWRPVWLENPALSAELLGYIWFNEDPKDFRALSDRLAVTNLQSVLDSTKERLATSFSPSDLARLAYDPYEMTDLPASTMSQIPSAMRDQNWFASADGTYHVLFVEGQPGLTDYPANIQWMAQMRQIVAAWKSSHSQYANAQVQYTGPPAFVAEAAQGMRQDLTDSVIGTLVFIGLLFWLAYGNWRPLAWIVVLLAAIVGGALALGGLVLGTLNVVSLGFAGILLGITADYALVIYQSALAGPEDDPKAAAVRVRAGILWSALATAGAFLILRASGFPGLEQLGTLAAIGLILGAILILTFFPVMLRRRPKGRIPRLPAFTRSRVFGALGAGAVVIFIILGWAWRRPIIDYSGNALQPANSQPYAALQEMEKELGQSDEPEMVVVRGATVEDTFRRLTALDRALQEAQARHELSSYMLPVLLWPRPEAQAANRATAEELWQRRHELRNAALTNGFSSNALVLSSALLETWHDAAQTPGVFWPTNEMSRWILQRVSARTTNGFYAMGPVYPLPHTSSAAAASLAQQLPQDQTWLAGWQPLAGELLRRIGGRLEWILGSVLVLLLTALWLAFRSWKDVALGFGGLAMSGLLLCALMQLLGWSWNLLNVMAVPLLLGAGVDYTILTQLALRRNRGDLAAMHREIGVALVLSCATAAIGFGSLSWASNAGLASLGRVCALGIVCTGWVAIFLLPLYHRAKDDLGAPPGIYSAGWWRIALFLPRMISGNLLGAMAEQAASLYARVSAGRRAIVVENLLPVLAGNRPAAEAAADRLFRNFGRKLADLWRCEAGLPAAPLITGFVGAEPLLEAHQRKQGVLLVTPHLGNWEVGGYALAARGIKLHVVTLSEPAEGLTELRSEARQRNGIETIVVGDDPFAFVKIIKLLQEGAIMALLLDRPRASSRVTVELFGRPFQAAIAAADLARASGCMILPVFLPRSAKGYEIELLPPVAYNRDQLGEREARERLTQEIFRAFEPFIARHADQWYHFIPVWRIN